MPPDKALEQFREKNHDQLAGWCDGWKTIKPLLEALRNFPLLPEKVKEAIDVRLDFGNEVCLGDR